MDHRWIIALWLNQTFQISNFKVSIISRSIHAKEFYLVSIKKNIPMYPRQSTRQKKYGGDATVYFVKGHSIRGERTICFMAFKYILNLKLEWENKHVWLARSLHFRTHCVWNLRAINMLGSIINLKYVIYWIPPCVWITGRSKFSSWFLLYQSTFKRQKKHDQAEGHLPFLTCKVQHIVPQLPREPATSKKNGNVLEHVTTEAMDYLN